MIIRRDFGALVSEARRLDDIADRIETRIERARLDMDDFLVVGWTGSSAAQFRAAFDRWLVAARANTTRLHAIVDAIRGATDEIAAGEEATAGVSDAMADEVAARGGVSESFARMMGGR